MQHFQKDSLEAIAVPLREACRDNAPLKTVVLADSDAILAIEKEWRGLEARCPNTVLFQSFDWCRNHMDFSLQTRVEKNEQGSVFLPRVFAVYRGKELVALLPLCLQAKGRMKVLTGFSEPFQQYTEILLSPDCSPSLVGQALLDTMSETEADYFHFGQVREEGDLARVFDGIVPLNGEKDAAPFVSLDDHEDHESYLKTIRSKTRKNLRNARNRLEREAVVEHRVAHEGELMGRVIDRAYQGREAWLERLGITSRAFRDQDFEAFLKRFADREKSKGVETIAMSLKHGDKAISDQWGFVYRGRYYAFMATWNPEYEAVSPGRLHLGEVIKTCFERGFDTADFMIPASSYKMTWTDQATPVSDFVLPLSLRGKLYTKLWLDMARPWSKKLFFLLPSGLRGLLVKRVLPSVE